MSDVDGIAIRPALIVGVSGKAGKGAIQRSQQNEVSPHGVPPRHDTCARLRAHIVTDATMKLDATHFGTPLLMNAQQSFFARQPVGQLAAT
jgi:hypothetical protein